MAPSHTTASNASADAEEPPIAWAYDERFSRYSLSDWDSEQEIDGDDGESDDEESYEEKIYATYLHNSYRYAELTRASTHGNQISASARGTAARLSRASSTMQAQRSGRPSGHLSLHPAREDTNISSKKGARTAADKGKERQTDAPVVEIEDLLREVQDGDFGESLFETCPVDEDDYETKKNFERRLIRWIGQMMFVSGETAEPGPETTWMIEEIVREQVLEMLTQATVLANRRGSRSISIVDLIFQIRHDRAKVSRLKTFLSWKDVRKNVKDSDDKGGGDAGDVGDFEEASGGVNPSAPQKSSGNKKAKLTLPWEVQSFYAEQVPERDDEEDEEEEEQNEATLARLASADERTKNMTREEYVYWSDCRQASFTFRKGKRFREWAGFGTIIDSKPNDDVVDILGFLTFEIVQTLTEEALRVKAAEDLANKKATGGPGGGRGNDQEASKKRKREGCSLFEMPEEGRTPVEPKHVREAFRRLQVVPAKYKFMRPGYAGMRTTLRLI